jgi:hypothetical protein
MLRCIGPGITVIMLGDSSESLYNCHNNAVLLRLCIVTTDCYHEGRT